MNLYEVTLRVRSKKTDLESDSYEMQRSLIAKSVEDAINKVKLSVSKETYEYDDEDTCKPVKGKYYHISISNITCKYSGIDIC